MSLGSEDEDGEVSTLNEFSGCADSTRGSLRSLLSTASRSACGREMKPGIAAPGLMPAGWSSQAKRFSRLFGSVAAPMVVRLPKCVRSGPTLPVSVTPRTVWQAPHPVATNSSLPAMAGRLSASSHAGKSAGSCTTTGNAMKVCDGPTAKTRPGHGHNSSPRPPSSSTLTDNQVRATPREWHERRGDPSEGIRRRAGGRRLASTARSGWFRDGGMAGT